MVNLLRRGVVNLNRPNVVSLNRRRVVNLTGVCTMGSEFIVITYLIQEQYKETPVFSFQMDNKWADNAKALGNELTRIISGHIRQ